MRKITDRDLVSKDIAQNFVAQGGPKRIVIVISGIRTNADWVDHAISQMQLMSADPVEFVKSADSRISTIQLITRIGLRSTRVKIKDQISNFIIKNLVEGHNIEISLLCHSLGTDIAADIVRNIDYKFEHIILMGAVCRKEKIDDLARSCHYITNIRGTLDQYPIIASLIRPDLYHTAGTFGYSSSKVKEIVWEYDHSSCTSWESIKESVLPIIETKTRLNGSYTRYFSVTYYTYSRYTTWFFGITSIISFIYYLLNGSYLSLFSLFVSILIVLLAISQYFSPGIFNFQNKIMYSRRE